MILRTTFSDTPVLSTALILRYPYLPLESANAPATSALSPAYLSTPSRAWWQCVLLQCLLGGFGSVFPQCGLMVFPGNVIVSR